MTPRPFFLIIVLICAGLLGYGYYLQFVEGLDPCPLCVFQRIAFMAVMAVAFIGLLHGPRRIGAMIYSGLASLSALIGAGIAGRQVWLQHLPPDQVPECGPGLDFMLEVFPLTEAISMVFSGSGECAEVDWTFLSFSIAEWSLAWFIALALAGMIFIIRLYRRREQS
ncbi:MAG: disulfide bond formation protein B [Gammaproteobacteria bacterium]